MDLPVNPPVAPMLAKPVDAIPDGDYVFEPKWDGFRSIVFRDGDEVEIGSRNERPMTRYFPELVAAIKAELPRAVRDRRGDRDPGRRGQAAGLRGAAAADPPGGQPGRAAGDPDAGALHGVRPARAGRHRLHGAAVRRAPGRARGRPGQRGLIHPPDPDDHRPGGGHRLVQPVRGGRPGRADRQARRRDLRAGQAGDEEDQARAHRGLRGGRLPGAQERGGPDRVPAARPVPGRRQAGQRRRDRRVPYGEADRAVHRAAAAGHHVRPAPVELGRAAARPADPAGGHVQPVERQQGPVVHPAAPGARGRGPLRPHGGPAVPAHRAVRPLAAGPRAALVHLRPARGAGQLRPRRDPGGPSVRERGLRERGSGSGHG